jgi:hypothetical protein
LDVNAYLYWGFNFKWLTVPRFYKSFGVKKLIYSYMSAIDHWRNPAVDGRIILSESSVSEMWGYGLDRCGSGYGQVAGTCECSNEPLGSIKRGEFLD